jgi:formylglycine-generating enzyme required for sulfatase activity
MPDDGGFGRGNHPVINVRWTQTQTYVRWLSRETGQRYRLLSDAEWEYAARAGADTPYYTGASVDAFDANFNNRLRRTQPVGAYPPNQFGLYDMIGNVWTRVQDCWHDTYDGAPTDGSAWDERDCDNNRVMRGGAWGSDPTDLRSANRIMYYQEIRNGYVGFRIARDLRPR